MFEARYSYVLLELTYDISSSKQSSRSDPPTEVLRRRHGHRIFEQRNTRFRCLSTATAGRRNVLTSPLPQRLARVLLQWTKQVVNHPSLARFYFCAQCHPRRYPDLYIVDDQFCR